MTLKKIENDGAATELAARIQLKHDFGIFCLTPEPKNMLMWAHYADSHKGFVVGFDMKSDFLKIENYSKQWLPRKVEYLNARHNIKYLSNVTNQEFENLIYTKALCWEYEKEYRMLCPLERCSPAPNDKTIKGFHLMPPSAIKCVIFGACMSKSNIERCCGELEMSDRYFHIQKKKAVISRKSYSLDIKKMP